MYRLRQPATLASLKEKIQFSFVGIDREIKGITSIDVCEPDSLSFCIGPLPKDACGVVVANSCESRSDLTVIECTNPRLLFSKIVNTILYQRNFEFLHQETNVDPSSSIASSVIIGVNCKVGKNTTICENVVIHDSSVIGDNVIIRENSIIGAEGFGFERDPEQRNLPIAFPHLAGVVIEDFVEVGSNTVVAKGALNDTYIRRGTKINSLVRIAHHCDIGENTLVMAGVILGGGVRIGSNALLGTNSTVRQKISLGNNVVVGSGAVVVNNFKDNSTAIGNPARELRKI